jgi:CDP-glycerol glycerophosphotransferase
VVVHGLDESEDGALAVVTALRERGVRPVRLTDGADRSPFRVPGVRYRSKYTLAGFWSFARASVVITSQALYGGRGGGPRQRTVLLWHGELVKPVGLLVGDRALAADVAPVCSTVARTFRVAEFGLQPQQVPVIGSPRNDRLLSADRDQVREILGWPAEQPTWLWLPTYRTAVRGERRREGQELWQGLPYAAEDLTRLDRLLADRGLTVVLKPHPLAEQGLRHHDLRALQMLSQADLERLGVSLYQVMAAADGLITDASSAWVDFLLLDKPMVFAFPDLEQYRADRGLNLEPYEEWVPGPVVAEVADLVESIGAAVAGEDRYAARRRSTLAGFHQFRDSGSAARLLDLLEVPLSSSRANATSATRPSGERRPRRARRRVTR